MGLYPIGDSKGTDTPGQTGSQNSLYIGVAARTRGFYPLELSTTLLKPPLVLSTLRRTCLQAVRQAPCCACQRLRQTTLPRKLCLSPLLPLPLHLSSWRPPPSPLQTVRIWPTNHPFTATAGAAAPSPPAPSLPPASASARSLSRSAASSSGRPMSTRGPLSTAAPPAAAPSIACRNQRRARASSPGPTAYRCPATQDSAGKRPFRTTAAGYSTMQVQAGKGSMVTACPGTCAGQCSVPTTMPMPLVRPSRNTKRVPVVTYSGLWMNLHGSRQQGSHPSVHAVCGLASTVGCELSCPHAAGRLATTIICRRRPTPDATNEAADRGPHESLQRQSNPPEAHARTVPRAQALPVHGHHPRRLSDDLAVDNGLQGRSDTGRYQYHNRLPAVACRAPRTRHLPSCVPLPKAAHGVLQARNSSQVRSPPGSAAVWWWSA